MTVIAFSSTIGPVPINVFIREKHESDLTITKVPIERGADATDHAFRRPNKLSIEIADGAAVATWQALKRFQQTRRPFNIVSGLDVYSSMLIEHLEAELDSTHSRILYGKADLSEIIIAETAAEEAGPGGGGDNGSSGRPGNANQKKAQPGGKKSTRTATPTSSRTKGPATKARAGGKVVRGDVSTKTVEAPAKRQSIAKSLFGAQ